MQDDAIYKAIRDGFGPLEEYSIRTHDHDSASILRWAHEQLPSHILGLPNAQRHNCITGLRFVLETDMTEERLLEFFWVFQDVELPLALSLRQLVREVLSGIEGKC